jgi:tetratricopeptide (TPR) repeat protein
MKYMIAFFVAFLATAGLATCPKNPSIGTDLNRAYDELKFAKFSADAQHVTDQLWSLWTKAPDGKAQRLLNNGMLKMRQGDLDDAEADLTELVAYCPNYAEGYNQRAFARYLSSKFKDALPDLEKALSIRPRHLGALSGAGLTYLALGQVAKAEIQFRKLFNLNPFTPERNLIPNLGTDL